MGGCSLRGGPESALNRREASVLARNPEFGQEAGEEGGMTVWAEGEGRTHSTGAGGERSSATLHLSSLGDPTWQSRSARFTDEETETRRGEGPCPRPRKSWNLNTDISMPFNMPCVLFQRMGNGNQVTPNQHDADD